MEGQVVLSAARGVDFLMPIRTISRASKSAQAPQSHFANVNGVRFDDLISGQGEPVVLLLEYAETSHVWHPLMAEVRNTRAGIAPHLRGAGPSPAPPGGSTKAAMARDIHALLRKLGYEPIRIVGNDIGLGVARAYAAQYPSEVDPIALMDPF
jgi:pimeloyl-ACP methyl ester carboxylesterase